MSESKPETVNEASLNEILKQPLGYVARATSPPWTAMDSLRQFLFPYRRCPDPSSALCGDTLICRVRCRLSFMDRLRLLISGHLMVESRTATEWQMGQTKTASACYVLAPGKDR